uniref:Zinc finger, CCHC-type n=1 Tax=Tanacetum cinerariifolium TaxID=118510 RepID=A0A6L2LU07_TANCI|nr:zinc finger, CCHC-type [Tanacetum cinerariifolium]
MGDENPIRTLKDYSRPSHESYRNTIELPGRNNVVPLRSDSIRLVQNGCLFHGLQYEDLNKHRKDFLKLVDSLELDVANKERMHLCLFLFSLRDQASNWLERLPAGSISTWEDLTTRESLSEAWTRFKDLLQKVPHHVHALMCNVILDKYIKSLELGENGFAFIQGEMPKKKGSRIIPLPCRLGDFKPFDTLADLGSCVNLIPLYLFKRLKIRLLEETGHVFGLADETKSYPVGIVKHYRSSHRKVKTFRRVHVIEIEKDPETSLLVGRGFLATASVVIDCKKAKIAVGEGVTRSIFGVKEISLGDEEVTYWTTLCKIESYKPRPSTDGIGSRPLYYAKKDFMDY